MLRLIGILTGSAIAIAFLIIALGVPEFSKQPEEAAGDGLPVTEYVGGGLPATATEDPVGGGLPATLQTDALIEDIFAEHPADDESIAAEAAPTPAEATPMQDYEVEPLVEDNWYAFWSPFRSELAANGFVSQLQETTGIDYRVVKVKTGVYEVAFAYTDDADIQDKLARISNATGLDMTGG